jgi:hypothetical protein
MSQTAVGIVIDRLLTDERFRVRFTLDRIKTLLDLSILGIDLTPDEINVFLHTDARVWFRGRAVAGDRAH